MTAMTPPTAPTAPGTPTPGTTPGTTTLTTAAAPASSTPAGWQRPPSRLARLWQRTRFPLLLIALASVSVTVLVLAAPQGKSNDYLDPADASGTGAKALAVILVQRGFQFTSVYSPSAALSAIGSRTGRPTATLVITSPDLLTAAQRGQLANADAELVLVEPGAAALRSLAPAIAVANLTAPIDKAISPSCSLPAATLAGSADAGGLTYQIPASATGCYPINGHPSVVTYRAGHRTITIIGNGLLLADGLLGQEGNAALALDLLSAQHTIVWLTPEPKVAAPHPRAAGRPKPALIPGAAWLVVLQLFVALLLAALWRMRRFGPLITERLPVVVRASETVEGHARLYQSRRARARAAAALRTAMLARVQPALGLAVEATPDAVIDGLASRSSRTRQQIEAIGFGPPPGSDADLVALAHELDELEREVRSQ